MNLAQNSGLWLGARAAHRQEGAGHGGLGTWELLAPPSPGTLCPGSYRRGGSSPPPPLPPLPPLSLRCLDGERGRCGPRPLANGDTGTRTLPSPLPSPSFHVPSQHVKGAHGAASEGHVRPVSWGAARTKGCSRPGRFAGTDPSCPPQTTSNPLWGRSSAFVAVSGWTSGEASVRLCDGFHYFT